MHNQTLSNPSERHNTCVDSRVLGNGHGMWQTISAATNFAPTYKRHERPPIRVCA